MELLGGVEQLKENILIKRLDVKSLVYLLNGAIWWEERRTIHLSSNIQGDSNPKICLSIDLWREVSEKCQEFSLNQILSTID